MLGKYMSITYLTEDIHHPSAALRAAQRHEGTKSHKGEN